MDSNNELTKIQENFINHTRKSEEKDLCSSPYQTILPYTLSNCKIHSQSSIIKKVKINDNVKSWRKRVKIFRKYQLSENHKYFTFNCKPLEWISSFFLVFGILICFLTIFLTFICPKYLTFCTFLFGGNIMSIGLGTLMALISNYHYMSMVTFCGCILFFNGLGLFSYTIIILTKDEDFLFDYLTVLLGWQTVFIILLIQLYFVIHYTVSKVPMKMVTDKLKEEEERIKNFSESQNNNYTINGISYNIPLKYMV